MEHSKIYWFLRCYSSVNQKIGLESSPNLVTSWIKFPELSLVFLNYLINSQRIHVTELLRLNQKS